MRCTLGVENYLFEVDSRLNSDQTYYVVIK